MIDLSNIKPRQKIPLVSVIIPCYNVDKYVDRCLTSIQNQTLFSIEVICVNDGSTDSTREIIQRFVDSDKRFKLIDNTNHGYGYSINCGIKASSGKYIGIVESDDWIEPNMYSDLVDIARKTNVDMVRSNFRRVYSDHVENIKVSGYNQNLYNRVVTTSDKDWFDIFNITINIWTSIYKSSYIKTNNVFCNETPNAAFQDNGFFFKSVMFAKSYYISDKIYYNYYQGNCNSSTNTCGNTTVIFDEYRMLYDFVKNSAKENYLKYLVSRKVSSYLYQLSRVGEDGKKLFLEKFKNELEYHNRLGEFDINILPVWTRDALKTNCILPLKPLISIITPIFNGEKYISKYFDSVLGQSYDNIEIICIDDASTDKTEGILNTYANSDTRVRVIKNAQNKGPASSRNKGIELARGDYVQFVDVDDVYPTKDSLKNVVEQCIDIHHPNVICGLLEQRDESGQKVKTIASEVFNTDKFDNRYYTYNEFQGIFMFQRYLFNLCFLKKNNISFPDWRSWEDVYFLIQSLNIEKKIFCVNIPLYVYTCTEHFRKRDFSNNKTIEDKFTRHIKCVSKLIDCNLYSAAKFMLNNSFSHRELYQQFLKGDKNIKRLYDVLQELEYKVKLNDTKPLVSVIIPCYNVEQYIDQCLTSIIDNGYSNLEIICIDDRSTDSTVEHINNFQKKYNNIQLYHNELDHNIYGGACRNIGLKHASGKYVYFCDSDDYTLPGLFNECVDRCEKTIAEMCFFKHYKLMDGQLKSNNYSFRSDLLKNINLEVYGHENMNNIFTIATPEVWGKLYLREHIELNHIRFQEIKNCNDVYFYIKSILCSTRITHVDKEFYVYRRGVKTSVQSSRIKGDNEMNFVIALKKLCNEVCSTNNERVIRHFKCWVLDQIRYYFHIIQFPSSEVINELVNLLRSSNIYTDQINSIIEEKMTKSQLQQNVKLTCWSMFDKIICIHYLPYTERFENIKSELKRVGILDLPQFEWYETIDNNYYRYVLNGSPDNRIDKGQISVNETNINYTIDSYSLLKKLLVKGYERVLIIEDDVVFHKDLGYIFDMIQNTPKDFDIVNYDPFYPISTLTKVTSNKNRFCKYTDEKIYNTSCIAFSKHAISRIVQEQEQVLRPFDHYTWMNTNDLNKYAIRVGGNICIQDLTYEKRQNHDTIQFISMYKGNINLNNFKQN